MFLKIILLVIISAIVQVGADSVAGEPSKDNPLVLKVNKEFIDEDHWMSQAFFRIFTKSYGNKDLMEKSKRLRSLIDMPPYGRFKSHCNTMVMVRKDLFFYGSLIPEFVYLFYGSLGKTLQGASNKDGSKKPFTKFFDAVSRRMDCIGYEADQLMLKLEDYYPWAATDNGDLAKRYRVNEAMLVMYEHIKRINKDDEVIFDMKKQCNIKNLQRYILDKLKEIEHDFEILSEDASDEEIGNEFEKFRGLSPVTTTLFICKGARDKLADEIHGKVIFKLRDVLRKMMAKETEKEKKLLTTIHNASFSLSQLRHKRFPTVHIPKSSTISCYGQNKTLDEDARIIVRYCFVHCRRLIEEKEKACKGGDGSEANCQTCQVVVPKEKVKGMSASQYTYFKEEMSDEVVYHFMAVDFDMMIPPLLTPNDIQKLLDYNVDFERDPPPDYTLHIEPMGKYRFPYEEPEELDWRPYLWLSLKTAIGTTMAIWTLYFVNVYRFRFGRWLNRRWDQLYRRILGM